MKKELVFFLVLFVTNSCLKINASPLEGIIDKGYDVPYLWDSYSGYTNKDWMSGIDGRTHLSEISIPGTHNSMSLYGGDLVATQTLDISEQLDMGIRYIDARFKYRSKDLWAYHGPVSQHQTFSSFLAKVATFLDSAPSETVLIRIQNEGGASEHQEEFFQRFQEVLSDYKHLNVVPSSSNPILEDVRGKFVFIRDFNVFGKSIGIERSHLHIQDNYRLSTNWDLYSKWLHVKGHFASIKSDRISLNYLSGSVGSFPYFVASGKSSPQSHAPQLWTGISTTNGRKYPDFPRVACLGYLCSINFSGINQLTNKWIVEGKLPNNLGVVVMDFPGASLVDNIIQTNRAEEETDSHLVIYENVNQQGKSLSIYEDVSFLGAMNDEMSSWKIPDNWVVRFYEHADFKGRYYTRSMDGNTEREFNDLISSVKILRR